MKKRLQKKSEVLREGYVKGLRRAKRIIAEMLQTADGRTIQDDARVWVDTFSNFCVENGKPATLAVIYDDLSLDSFEVDSVKYDKEGNRFVIEAYMEDDPRPLHFFINDARNVMYDSEVSDIPAASVDVETRQGHGAVPLVDVFKGAECIALYDCPEFSEAFPRYGSNF